jgi:hypothetical protein
VDYEQVRSITRESLRVPRQFEIMANGVHNGPLPRFLVERLAETDHRNPKRPLLRSVPKLASEFPLPGSPPRVQTASSRLIIHKTEYSHCFYITKLQFRLKIVSAIITTNSMESAAPMWSKTQSETAGSVDTNEKGLRDVYQVVRQ